MTNLKEVNFGQNKFCGPAVLSILTGKSTDECADVISQINGKYIITGVFTTDLIKAATKLGFTANQVSVDGSLYRVLTGLVHSDGIYLVVLPKHFVCVEVSDKKIYFCDNHTKMPIPAASSSRLGMGVESVYKVVETPKPKIELVIPNYITVILSECKYCSIRATSPEVMIHRVDCKYRIWKESNDNKG
jgi:hypothetical protein